MRVAIAILALVARPMWPEGQATARPLRIMPATLPRIASVDERYQSYDVEMAEVIGGNFWKPYTGGSMAETMTKAKAPPRAGASRRHDARRGLALTPLSTRRALRSTSATAAPPTR